LTVLLYIETNFLMSHATGRAIATESLISVERPSIRLVIPSFCFVEAFSTLEDERKRHNRLIEGFQMEIRQAKRNLISPRADALVNHLQQTVVESLAIFNDFEDRLFRTIELLASRAELIDPTPQILQDSLSRKLIADPTDNLILSAIVAHAGSRTSETKAFLTENRKCFHDNLEARAALQSVGLKYFADASKCLEWHGALPDQ
jgi:hypothetical protein